ncbi:MAG: fimbrillin family protein [Odoribacter sp.]|nr:fimbrillin family protein [Odoribacter sp.]
MKLQYSILGIILSVVLLLAGCKKDDDDEIPGATGELHLSAEIKGMSPDEATTRFRAGQGVGVWLSANKTDADLNRAEVAKNLCFMQSAGGLVSEPATNWNRQPSLELYAYAPYDEKASENPAAYPFSIEPNQDSLALLPEGNEKNDLLYARQTVKYSDEATTVSFRHLMSKVVLHIRSSSSVPGALTDAKVAIGNVLLDAAVDLGTGVVTAKGDRKQVKSAALENVPDGYEIACEAIIAPQTVTNGTPLLEILTTSNYTYTWNADKDLAFESGKQIVLDVLVKETECVVRIKEIADWRDNEKLTGVAEEDLPTFKVYDFYDRHGIQGIVINVDETGKHGWIVSLDETELVWCTNPGQGTGDFPNANNNDDAQANLEAVLEIDPTLADYPAFKWCKDKNENGVTGWVLPAYNVLKLFGQTVLKDEASTNAFNSAIQNAPIDDEKKNEVYIDRSSAYAFMFYCYYYSSTLRDDPNTVKTCAFEYGSYKESAIKDQRGHVYTDEDYNIHWDPIRVRAFHEF